MQKERLVFDPRLWKGKDVGDNSQFWRLATILREHWTIYGVVADVKWPDGSVTHGHFVANMMCPECRGRMRDSMGQWCPNCAKEELK